MEETYYLTFGQGHPLRDAWIEIKAIDYVQAREKAVAAFGLKWSNLYTGQEFVKSAFPQGKVGYTL